MSLVSKMVHVKGMTMLLQVPPLCFSTSHSRGVGGTLRRLLGGAVKAMLCLFVKKCRGMSVTAALPSA